MAGVVGGTRAGARRLHLQCLATPYIGTEAVAGPSRTSTALKCRCSLTSSSLTGRSASTVSLSKSSQPRYDSARVTVARRAFSVTASTKAKDDAAAETEIKVAKQVSPETGTGDKAADVLKQITFFADDVADAAPTLEYLDTLKPKPRRKRNERQNKRTLVSPFGKAKAPESAEDKDWKRTRDLINVAFTRDQLASLGREAKLPGSYSKKVKKEELIRRIMIHRFRMEDAQERQERLRKEEREKANEYVQFEPAELFLLLSRGTGKLRDEAGKAAVAILPNAPDADSATKTSGLGFWIRGKEDGIAKMRNWASEFKQRVQRRQDEISLFDPSSDSAINPASTEPRYFVPTQLSQFVSRLSRCFVEVQTIEQGRLQLSLVYLDTQEADKAMLMLRRFLAEVAQSGDRAGAAAHADNLDVLRQYSMLPFVPNEPSSWLRQAEDMLTGANPELTFRVAQVPDQGAFMPSSPTALPDMAILGWHKHGELGMSEPFEQLHSLLPKSSTASTAEYSAELGHVLFSSNALTLADDQLTDEQLAEKMQDPLAAPRPGIWPVEHVAQWAREFRKQWGREASRFVPATFFRAQKDLSLVLWLDKHGWTAKAAAGREQVVLTYQNPSVSASMGPKLEVVLEVNPVSDDSSASWSIQHVRWTSTVQSDMMVPEHTIDLRLSSQFFSEADSDLLLQVQTALQGYLEHDLPATQDINGAEDGVTASTVTAGASQKASRRLTLPPSRIECEAVGPLTLEKAEKRLIYTYHQRSDDFFANTEAETTQTSSDPAQDEAGVSESVIPEESSPEMAAPATVQAEQSPLSVASEGEAEAEVEAQDETEAEKQTPTESPAEQPKPNTPRLVRQISQDPITGAIIESLKLTWSSTAPPSWPSSVGHISSLIERYDSTVL
ncbi:hypothetical protein BCV70DRAFT_198844 [Testicularia cyperi]|uniref:Uncharacterized protein n=1 Tax=Testicularia cyperi TaxID=1882483 RepID=A0A317XUC6_9BASI|nr:hypothetical protein BCV70DRAFT_198844 [Testicularia cyperi]